MAKGISNGRQTLIAVGVLVMIALLATQTYAFLLSTPGPGPKTATGASQLSGSYQQNDTITVSGSGVVQVTPDRVILSIGVVTQATTADEAVRQNANEMSAVIAALEGIGISNSSIQTTSYSIYPQSNCCNNEPPNITGYQVSNDVQVTIVASGESLAQLGAKAGQAIDVAASSGANEIDSIEFSASGGALQQVQQEAIQQAVQNASADAHVLASALGVSITGVVSATTSPEYTPEPYFTTVMAAAVSTPIIAPQSLSVSATVQVVYAIS